MNNYNIASDYYNYLNNNYNQPIYNQDNFVNSNQKNALYDPYQGYIRGNLFPDLYNPYKEKDPYEIRPMNKQAEMLTYMDMYSFAAHDLNLFLDVHPNDQIVIDLFNKYRREANKLIVDYQNEYGPLVTNSDALNAVPWAWDDRPWPWENK